MKIGVLTIGAELLNGARIDTNSNWISKTVIDHGGMVEFNISTKDNQSSIIKALDFLLDQSIDMIIMTGGLGPTHDDITAKTLFEYFDDIPILDEKYWNFLVSRFKKKGFKVSALNKTLALKPSNGKIIDNPIGTARGLHFSSNKKEIIALPGVPSEMKSMMREATLPMIKKISQKSIHSSMLRTTGITESSLYEKLFSLIKQAPDVELAFLPSLFGVDLRISSTDNDKFSNFLMQVKILLDEFIYSDKNLELEEVVVNLLNNHNLTVATAESCTGGLIGDRITNTSGVSRVFKGGIIAYSNEIKINQLGVKKETIEKFGAVSMETASEMAAGVQKLFSTDIGISSTGIAGPLGGNKDKPVGLVYIAISINGVTTVYKNNFKSNRKNNKRITSQVALNLVRKELLKF